MRSPAAYEKLRESVKGPEELEREMEQNEAMAELKFALETEPRVQEVLCQEVEKYVQEEGIENITEATVSAAAMQAIEAGNFSLAIESSDQQPDQLVLQVEGNVNEKLPIKPAITNRFF